MKIAKGKEKVVHLNRSFMFEGTKAAEPAPLPEGVRERSVNKEDLPKLYKRMFNKEEWLQKMIEYCEDSQKFGARAIRPIIRHMDRQCALKAKLSPYRDGGLPEGETMEDFKKWFIKTYVKNEDKESALKLAEMYNPTGKILTTVLTDMEEYFVQAEELLTVHRACLLLKRKVPRDVLTEVTREDLHNLEELVTL
eukprot:Nk52_evm1s693 gene=Nk52_evmTU1s693